MGEPIQTPIVGANLREFFRLVGSVSPELEGSVVPTVLVGDLSGGSPAVRTRHAAAQIAITPTGTNLAFFEFSCTDPNTLGVVTDIWVSSDAANDELLMASASTILTVGKTAAVKRFRDARVRVNDLVPAFDFFGEAVAGGVIAANIVSGKWSLGAANLLTHLEPKRWAILGTRAPTLASGLTFCGSTLLAKVTVTIEWDEFQLP